MKTLVVGGSNSKHLAKKIAKRLGADYSELDVKNFPDGELYVRYLADVSGKRVVLVQTMHPRPSESLVEIVFAVTTAKELGAARVVVVAPYLAYLRQDKRFRPGECQSNRIAARLLSVADELITVDPHLHRISSLNEIFRCKTKKLTADSEIAKYIAKNMRNEELVGPDIESSQWVEEIAKMVKLHAQVLLKKRYSSEVVRIKVRNGQRFRNKNVVIIDDIVSTGHTMIEPIKQLKRMGAKRIYCICVHGIFAKNALQMLRKLGAEVVSTNTIQNPVAKIDLSGVIADALK